MSDYLIMKAVEYDKLPVKFKKAHPFDGLMAEGYWLQKKYDGCMGIVVGDKMLSRTGEDYTRSCGHLVEEVRRHIPSFNVIGEVWQPPTEALFPAISGKFRRHSPSPELMFIVNDVVPKVWHTAMPYSHRHAMLMQALAYGDRVLPAATYHVWAGPAHYHALEWQGMGGYDGAILRNPRSGYTVGTVKNGEIIKVKPVMALDLMVTDVFVEKGEKTGRDVFSIEVEYCGVRSKVGSGVPHKSADVPGRGQIAEVECLGITADGRLREPRFKGIRFDKLEADK